MNIPLAPPRALINWSVPLMPTPAPMALIVISVPEVNEVFLCEPKFQVVPSITPVVPEAPETHAQPPLVVSFAPKDWVATERNRVVVSRVIRAAFVLVLPRILEAKLLATHVQVVVKKFLPGRRLRTAERLVALPILRHWIGVILHTVTFNKWCLQDRY